jgi:uncharacterized protein (UPF0179 family)
MENLPVELQAKISEAKSWLFDGDLDKIAKRSNKSKEWACKVMNGHAFNVHVVEAAIEVMNENKARFQISQPSMKVA